MAKPKTFRIGSTVLRRNPIICELFARIHFGEKMGTGFRRMKDICKMENSPLPEVEYDECYFYIIFKQSYEYLKMAGKKQIEQEEAILNTRQQNAFLFAQKNGSISIQEYIGINKVSDKTARTDLKEMVKMGIFKKEGITTGLKFKLTSVNFGN